MHAESAGTTDRALLNLQIQRQTEPLTVAAISSSTPRWLEIILEGYNQDDQTKQLLTELSLTGSNDKQSVRFVVNDRGLFTAGWFGVREKYYFSL